MTSWTESTQSHFATWSKTASASESHTYSSTGGEFSPKGSASGVAQQTTSVDSDGNTYVTATSSGEYSYDPSPDEGWQSGTASASYQAVSKANGSISASGTNEDYISYWHPIETASEFTFSTTYGGSGTTNYVPRATTRSGQTTTTQEQATWLKTTGTTTAPTITGSSSVNSLSETVPYIATTPTTLTSDSFISSTITVTAVTTYASSYTGYAANSTSPVRAATFAAATNVLLSPNEMAWIIRSDWPDASLVAIDGIAYSTSGAFTVSPLFSTVGAFSGFVTATGTSSVGSSLVTETITISSTSQQTTTAAGYNGTFPLATGAFTAQVGTTGTTLRVNNVTEYLSGPSRTLAALQTTTFRVLVGASDSYAQTVYALGFETQTHPVGGLGIGTISSTKSSTATGRTLLNWSSTSYSSVGLQSQVLEPVGIATFSAAAPVLDETTYANGWAALSNVSEAKGVVGLEGSMTLRADTVLGGAFFSAPRPTSFTYAVWPPGTTTFSIDAAGASATSIGTATDAETESTSAAWTVGGVALTNREGFLFQPAFGLYDFGGVPPVGSAVGLAVPPGHYYSKNNANSMVSVAYSNSTSFAGTAASALRPAGRYYATRSGSPFFVSQRNEINHTAAPNYSSGLDNTTWSEFVFISGPIE